MRTGRPAITERGVCRPARLERRDTVLDEDRELRRLRRLAGGEPAMRTIQYVFFDFIPFCQWRAMLFYSRPWLTILVNPAVQSCQI